MTRFELVYVCLRPFEHPLYQFIQKTLRSLSMRSTHMPRILDIGGRRSNYTINVPAEVWITDLPRECAIQHQLDLGATDAIRSAVLGRRSNVIQYIYDDMCDTKLPESSFDIVTAVEVLEHVEQDDLFLANVRRVLRPGGTFIMTTPNGDRNPIPYPDHKRHHLGRDLQNLLTTHFSDVRLEYRVTAGRLFNIGLHRPSSQSPFRTVVALFAFAFCALLENLWTSGNIGKSRLHITAICT